MFDLQRLSSGGFTNTYVIIELSNILSENSKIEYQKSVTELLRLEK
jgi:hypothetical protein